jgi:hypothetical protein
MERSPRHPVLAALLAILAFTAAAILPIGSVANAAPAPTICQPGEGNACFLVISAPQSVAVGEPFTVTVTLFEYGNENPIPLPKSDFCASRTVVSLDLFQGEGPVTTYSSKASGGVATFSISVADAGSWSLDAYVDHGEGNPNCGYYDPDFASFTAVVIPPGQPIEPCPPDTSCVQVTSGSGTAATLFADSGTFFDVSFGPLVGQGCGDGGPADTNGVLSFNYSGVDPKIIVIWLKDATKPAGHYKICWQSPNAFTPLGDGAMVNVGYLPKCGKKEQAVAPCVLDADNGKHHTASFEILAPPGDPQVYPE